MGQFDRGKGVHAISRVFVLTTGRSGSLTFIKAASHATNYTAGHETHTSRQRRSLLLDYPDNHIEADRHLVWLLGSLDAAFGDDPLYVHLIRNEEAVARSWMKRMPDNENWLKWLRIQAELTFLRRFRRTMALTIGHMLFGPPWRLSPEEQHQAALAYVRSANANIRMFLRDKTKKIVVQLEHPRLAFTELWTQIEATGDLDAALAEFDIHHNASDPN